jgi:hypothetical protein
MGIFFNSEEDTLRAKLLHAEVQCEQYRKEASKAASELKNYLNQLNLTDEYILLSGNSLQELLSLVTHYQNRGYEIESLVQYSKLFNYNYSFMIDGMPVMQQMKKKESNGN